MSRIVVDARGSFCPGPLMELVKTIKDAEVGTEIEVLSSDESSAKDIPEWVKKAGHELVGVEKKGDYWSIVVKKLK
ncbi:putative redox protein, regulator of disulfide bond formation [Archaeoglobus sulfaticallidus PM70-1]|uniref:Putative redox protein, regulator of disulfide bond formation n=1 Tax=Archaeoglobus sulfaticallidus PM70-1 TaxID=387631 RepID=N0BIF4_9EURY|nr:sulfurtransferase TusA family protein [Archaeoglobus sulfaticallidus]AGK60246.1 putative redox protein, regulator of disulfide bond formation [Archaeoglobus sulfaticallidus PM70-1]